MKSDVKNQFTQFATDYTAPSWFSEVLDLGPSQSTKCCQKLNLTSFAFNMNALPSPCYKELRWLSDLMILELVSAPAVPVLGLMAG